MKPSKQGICTAIAGACCFGLLNIILAGLGLTAAVNILNKGGDYIFTPAYGYFATLFIWSLLKGRRTWMTNLLAFITIIAGMVFMTFGITSTTLISAGIILGGVTIWLKRER